MAEQDDASYAIDNLLTNKLERPLVDARIVRRDALTHLLDVSTKRRVTLLVAPTGYGKTTLLVEWLSTSPAINQYAVWVTLDQFDNVPLHFWAYIVSGLKKAYPQLRFNLQKIGTIRQDYHPEDLALLNPLLNEVAEIPHLITLILDNYHTITNDAVHGQLNYFIEHLPPNLNLVISSRVTPRISLSRLRAQRQLLEITERELSFSLPEAQSFFAGVMDLDVDQEQVAALLNATEGWIAGLQLAALSYQAQSDPRLPVVELLQDNRLVLDYLTEEILNQQSADVKDFLLKSSTLEDLSAPLCDAVLERDDSAELLAKIEEANLFLVCLDHDRCGYRYHSLFAQVLQTRLRQTHPAEVSTLHLRACDWLLANGLPDKAVAHALAAGALEKAAEIMDACAMEIIWEYDLTRLLRWTGHFSKEMFIKRPQLGIYSAVANYHLQRLAQVEATLQEIEQVLAAQQHPLTGTTERLLQWELSAMRAIIECNQGDPVKGTPKVLAVLETHPPEEEYFYGFLTHTLAGAYAATGDLDAAAETYYDGVQFALQQNHPIPAVHSLHALAGIRSRQGRLSEAEKRYQEAFELAARFKLGADVTTLPQAGLLEIGLERNDIARIEHRAAEVVKGYHQISGSSSFWAWLSLISIAACLAKYYLTIEDRDKAVQYLEDLQGYLPENREASAALLSDLIGVHVHAGLAVDEIQIEGYSLPEIEAFLTRKAGLTPTEQLALARIHLANGRPDQARPVLESLESAIRDTEERRCHIEASALLALAYQELGQDGRAQQALEGALRLAEPEGYVRIFLDEGGAMRRLLSDYLSVSGSGELAPYVEQLVAAYDAQLWPASGNTGATLPGTTVLTAATQPLSQRELEVLHLLMTRKSYKEIAATLTISVNTIKIHVKNIYRKLGVHSRKVALERAAELGLVDGLA